MILRLRLFTFEIISTHVGSTIKNQTTFNLSNHLIVSLCNLKIGHRELVGIRFQYQKDDLK